MKSLRLSLLGIYLAMEMGLATEPIKIELPPETNAFKFAPGVEIANAQCLICHSVEYVSTQPSLPRTYWAGSVKKMREKYGAPIPDAQVEPLLDYLVAHYGAGTNSTVAATTTTQATSLATNSVGVLGNRYGCVLCHTVRPKSIGPPFNEVAAKYRNDPSALAKISEQVHKGGTGKWGPVIMPPFPMVTDEEVSILAEWILSQK